MTRPYAEGGYQFSRDVPRLRRVIRYEERSPDL